MILFFLSFYLVDSISESNPRVIDDTRARKLANDLKRCSYYETCATYGLNVERVFQDGEYWFNFKFHDNDKCTKEFLVHIGKFKW